MRLARRIATCPADAWLNHRRRISSVGNGCNINWFLLVLALALAVALGAKGSILNINFSQAKESRTVIANEKGEYRGTFGYFLPADKGKIHKLPTQSAARVNAMLNDRCSITRYSLINSYNSVCAALLIRGGGRKIFIPCVIEETVLPRWLYIQFGEHYPVLRSLRSRTNEMSLTSSHRALYINKKQVTGLCINQENCHQVMYK